MSKRVYLRIRYKSDNGYSGVMYGKSSLVIYNPEGKEIFHTGYRSINSADKLKKQIDEFPALYDKLISIYPKLLEDEEGEDT